jgi:NTP pyrophosphatase (non-canonical NTP hydrolase)
MKDLENKVYHHLKARRWDNLRPVDLAKSIMIEGAELLEIFQWENLSLAEVRQDSVKMSEIKKELADVMIYGLEMSVLLGLDTEKIIRQKLMHVAKKYPAKLMRKRTEAAAGSEYLRIKKEYRSQGL